MSEHQPAFMADIRLDRRLRRLWWRNAAIGIFPLIQFKRVSFGLVNYGATEPKGKHITYPGVDFRVRHFRYRCVLIWSPSITKPRRLWLVWDRWNGLLVGGDTGSFNKTV